MSRMPRRRSSGRGGSNNNHVPVGRSLPVVRSVDTGYLISSLETNGMANCPHPSRGRRFFASASARDGAGPRYAHFLGRRQRRLILISHAHVRAEGEVPVPGLLAGEGGEPPQQDDFRRGLIDHLPRAATLMAHEWGHTDGMCPYILST